MTDTITIIKTIHDTLRVSNSDTLETLSKVDSFYSSAWSKLILVGSIIGVILPIIYALYQRRLYQFNKKELADDIQALVNTAVTQKLSEHKIQIDKKIQTLDAATFHLQGNFNFNIAKNYEEAYIDFVTSAKGYFLGEDFVNLRIVLDSINLCLPKLTKKRYDELRETKQAELDKLLTFLEENQSANVLLDLFFKIRQTVISLRPI